MPLQLNLIMGVRFLQKQHQVVQEEDGSVNVLICDEFAFVKTSLEEEFLQSVFPVVSSSKTSKIIIVSTPNGMGNEFYRIWNKAQLKLSNTTDKRLTWKTLQIDWWEVPGRDENWRKIQLESFNNDQTRFDQEYGNSFLGSAETLIKANVIKNLKEVFSKNSLEPHEIQLNKDYESTKVLLYEPPIRGHAYVVGADPSMGTDADYHSLIVYDITNTFKIKQVVGFYKNNIPPKVFSYIIAKIAMLYNNAYVAIENNGCSQTVLDALWRDFDYDNIIHVGGNIKTNVGIHSSPELKMEACVNFKAYIEDPLRSIQYNDGRLLEEMEKFEKKSKIGKMPTYGAKDGHDDYMMAAIWGLYPLKMDIIDNYYDVKKTILNKLGIEIPLYVMSYDDENEVRQSYINSLDQKFGSLVKNYEDNYNNLIDETSENAIEDFIRKNNLNEVHYEKENDKQQVNHEEDDFAFRLFIPGQQ